MDSKKNISEISFFLFDTTVIDPLKYRDFDRKDKKYDESSNQRTTHFQQ